jgi:site-specific recombinase XerD
MHEQLLLLKNTITRIEGAFAPATIRAFKYDLENFIAYCNQEDQVALPSAPSSVANFIDHLTLQKLSSSYIRRIVASISTIHKLNRFDDPTSDPDVKIAMKKMHRTVGRFQHQAEPINKDILLKVIEVTEDSLMGDRDRVLLNVAYDTLCRRSELVSLRIEDIYLMDSDWRNETERSKIFLRVSKTDQEREKVQKSSCSSTIRKT